MFVAKKNSHIGLGKLPPTTDIADGIVLLFACATVLGTRRGRALSDQAGGVREAVVAQNVVEVEIHLRLG